MMSIRRTREFQTNALRAALNLEPFCPCNLNLSCEQKQTEWSRPLLIPDIGTEQ